MNTRGIRVTESVLVRVMQIPSVHWGSRGAYAYSSRVEYIMGEAHLWVQQRGRAPVDTCTAWGQHLCVQPGEASPLYTAWGQHDSGRAMESEHEARQVDPMDSVH